jgi:hypothetical protein
MLRAELADHERYVAHDAAASRSATPWTSLYNIERRHSFLGYLNPIDSNCVTVPFDEWHSQFVDGIGGSQQDGRRRPRTPQVASWENHLPRFERTGRVSFELGAWDEDD